MLLGVTVEQDYRMPIRSDVYLLYNFKYITKNIHEIPNIISKAFAQTFIHTFLFYILYTFLFQGEHLK